MLSLFLVAFSLSVAVIHRVDGAHDYYPYYQWSKVEYDLPSNVKLSSSEFIQENNFIQTIKIYGNRIWITTPRYRRGVPSTLNTVPYDRQRYSFLGFEGFHNGVDNPKLKPFPSYEMNKVGDCTALQLVQSMETDQFGRLWVVDVGRINILEPIIGEGPALNKCPAKLVVFDVSWGRSNILYTYTFPDNVVSRTSNILKDIQVTCTSKQDCWVYISDVFANRLVVYDHKNRRSWYAQHPSMAPVPNKISFRINGQVANAPFGITGLSVAPRSFDFSYIIFSPLASTTFYRVNTSTVQNPALRYNGALAKNDVLTYGEKPGQSDGIVMTSTGRLYYGNLPESSVLYTETSPKQLHLQRQKKSAQSKTDLLWPDEFSFDGEGNLLFSTTKFHLWSARQINLNEVNYRVIVLKNWKSQYAYNS